MLPAARLTLSCLSILTFLLYYHVSRSGVLARWTRRRHDGGADFRVGRPPCQTQATRTRRPIESLRGVTGCVIEDTDSADQPNRRRELIVKRKLRPENICVVMNAALFC